MPRVLFIAPHRRGRNPAQRFRLEQYEPLLAAAGFQCELSHLLSEKDDAVFYQPGHRAAKAMALAKGVVIRLKDVLRAGRYDVVFVQREATFLGTSFFERAMVRTRAKLVFDFDDAIWLPQVSEANKGFAWLKNPAKTADIAAAADLVITGNTYLADYARQHNSNVIVIPSPVDTERFVPRPPPATPPVVVGWSGSLSTQAHYARLTPVLARLKNRHGDALELLMIGQQPPQLPFPLTFTPWRLDTEIDDLARMHIGVMPLEDTEWERGKCGMKALIYMAMGVPTVASPVGVNAEIIRDGENGFLVADDREWEEKLEALMADADLRARLGAAGRRTVEERYSVTVNGEKLIAALRGVLA